MSDVLTYLVTLAAEVAGALAGKVYDPVAWFALIAALLLGGTIKSALGVGLGWGLLAFSVLMLESVYLGAVPRGDSAALALICAIGWVAGRQMGFLLRQRSA